MLQLTTAYVHQADRESAVAAGLRRHQLLSVAVERDTTPAVRQPVVTDRPAGRRPMVNRTVAASGR